MRANEKFSGRGQARHLCKDRARLGEEELAYRQSIRNLERLLTWDGRITETGLVRLEFEQCEFRPLGKEETWWFSSLADLRELSDAIRKEKEASRDKQRVARNRP